jgi:PadR family transcriptional regulator PadR
MRYDVAAVRNGKFDMTAWATQVRKGLTELAALAALRNGEAYGYQLLERLAKADGLEFSESTVYPLLTRLAKEGCLAVRTTPSEVGPPRRYYRLTSQGRARLDRMAAHWQQVVTGITGLLYEGASS